MYDHNHPYHCPFWLFPFLHFRVNLSYVFGFSFTIKVVFKGNLQMKNPNSNQPTMSFFKLIMIIYKTYHSYGICIAQQNIWCPSQVLLQAIHSICWHDKYLLCTIRYSLFIHWLSTLTVSQFGLRINILNEKIHIWALYIFIFTYIQKQGFKNQYITIIAATSSRFFTPLQPQLQLHTLATFVCNFQKY